MSKKISQLTEVSTNSTSDVFVCNQSGDTKKTTLQKIADAIFGAKTDNNLPHFSGTPAAGTTAYEIASKASAPTAITLTPATGVTSEYCLGAKIDKFVSGGIGFTADVTTNTWLSVGTLSVKPSATIRIPTNDSQGNYSGMIAIYNTGAVELFPKVTGTGRGIYFSFSFMTA